RHWSQIHDPVRDAAAPASPVRPRAAAMNWTPDFIDNRNGNTLAEALARVLGGSIEGGLAEAAGRPAELAIAAAFFSPKGLADLAPHIDGLERVRLLFGVEAPRDVELRRPSLGESPEHFQSRLMREGLKEAEARHAPRVTAFLSRARALPHCVV